MGTSAVDCASFCYHAPWCQGYIESLPMVVPRTCYVAGNLNLYIDVIPLLDTDKTGFTEFQRRQCGLYDNNTVCFPLTKVCIACPALPTQWQDQILPGYTLYFTHDCCSNNFATEWLRTSDPLQTNISIIFNTSFVIQSPQITISSAPGVQIYTSQCPLILLNQLNMVFLGINGLTVHCTNSSSNAAAVLVEYVETIALTVTNLVVTNAQAGITVLGGLQNNPELISGFEVTDLTNSYFSNITVLSDTNPIVAALALADFIGTNIALGTFANHTLVVVQPALDNNDDAAAFNALPDNIEVFDISAFTQVFGSQYEVSFYHAGAFESNEETLALRTFFIYQVYLALGLLGLLLILHQDIFYYIQQKRKIEDNVLKK